MGALDQRGGKDLSDALALIEHVSREIRILSERLEPTILEQGGLFPAIRWYAESLEKRLGVRLELKLPEPAVRLLPAIERALFRIVQEVSMHFQSYSNAGARVLFGAQEGSYYVEIHERPGNGRAPINGKSIEQLRIRLAALLQQLGDIGGELDLSLDQGLVVVRAAVPTYTASILPE